MQIGDEIGISLGGAYNQVSGRILTRGCMGEVVEVTEKAVKLSAKTDAGKEMTAWFPKKAFVPVKTSASETGVFIHGNHALHNVKLAAWFKVEGWTSKFLSMAGAY